MTSFRNEETEVQEVQCDLAKVTQSVNDRVIRKPPFISIMRLRDVRNAISFSRKKGRYVVFIQTIVPGHA